MKLKYATSKMVFIFLMLFVTSLTNAQKEFQGKAYYESKTTVDMNNFGGGQLSEERKKQIAERMKSALEKTYILTFNQSESLYKEEEKLDAPTQGGGMRFGMMSMGGGDQYKNIKDRQLLQEEELLGKQFLVKDSLPKLNWELGSETKMIGQYLCFKATAMRQVEGFDMANFGRRDRTEDAEKPKDSSKVEGDNAKEETPRQYTVTAWYSPQIPVNNGPSDYWGLPGLILEVSADRTTILCSKIILNPTEKEVLKKPSKGKEITKKEYDKLSKEKMEEMREMRGRGGRRN